MNVTPSPDTMNRTRGIFRRPAARTALVVAALGVAALATLWQLDGTPPLDAAAVGSSVAMPLAAMSTSGTQAARPEDTFHSDARWDQLEPEPEPSSQSVGAYER